MNLQSVLGTMLASGMAGRSRFGADGLGQVLSRAGGPAGFAPAGGGFKRMAGLGALGYLAYRALQDRRRNAGAPGSEPAGAGGGLLGDLFGLGDRGTDRPSSPQPGTAGSQGSLGERLSRVLQGEAETPAADALPETAMADREALLLIRAMITAANADGSISPDERQRILSATQEAGIEEEDRRVLERELDNPLPLERLLPEIQGDQEKAEQVFLASRAAVDPDNETGRAYLAYLATRLGIPADRAQAIQAA